MLPWDKLLCRLEKLTILQRQDMAEGGGVSGGTAASVTTAENADCHQDEENNLVKRMKKVNIREVGY